MAKFGPYEILDRIGCGGMGEIYLAVLKRGDAFEKSLVIKRILPSLSLDPSFVRMFNREARIAALLSHQNIVQIFDYGQEGGEYYIAMEYVEGADLRTLLVRQDPPPLEASLTILLGIARALDHAHRRCDRQSRPLDIVHRDVSPGNVLLSREGEVKLTDFGLVTGSIDDAESSAGEMKGKYAYMSPEQTYADPVDCRSDLFSWAVVAFELLSGRRPFTGNIIETVEAIRSGVYEPLGVDIPQDLEDLLSACLKVHCDERPSSAAELIRTLERVLVESARVDATRCLAEWVSSGCPESVERLAGLDQTEVGDAPIREGVSPALEDTHPRLPEYESPPPNVAAEAPKQLRRSRRLRAIGLISIAGLFLAGILLSATVFDWFAERTPPPEAALTESADPFEPVEPPESPGTTDTSVVPDTFRPDLNSEEPEIKPPLPDDEVLIPPTPLRRIRIEGEPVMATARLTLADSTEIQCTTPCDLTVKPEPTRLEVMRDDYITFDEELASTRVAAGSVRSLLYQLQPRERPITLEWRSRDLSLQGGRSRPIESSPQRLQVDFNDATSGLHGTLNVEVWLDDNRVHIDLSTRPTPWSTIELGGESVNTPGEIRVRGLRIGTHQLLMRPFGTGEPVSIDLVIREQ